MAFGQIDPARLQSEALKRWYLRSPAEIEEEREQKAASTYDAFFAPGRPTWLLNNRPQMRGHRAITPGALGSSLMAVLGEANADPLSSSGHHHLTAASPRGFWDYWSPRGCQNCHGHTPDTLPPIGGYSPFPPGCSPRTGNGSSGSQPGRRDKKECDQQLKSDSQICGRLQDPRHVAICRGTASDRYAHCLRPDGTIGFPHLETKGGRRR